MKISRSTNVSTRLTLDRVEILQLIREKYDIPPDRDLADIFVEEGSGPQCITLKNELHVTWDTNEFERPEIKKH